MAELQAAQQEALSTYEKGLGSTGSSTPPVLDPLPVQPINFIQTDGSPPAQELPAMPRSIFASLPEIILVQIAASTANAADAEAVTRADRNRHYGL